MVLRAGRIAYPQCRRREDPRLFRGSVHCSPFWQYDGRTPVKIFWGYSQGMQEFSFPLVETATTVPKVGTPEL